MIHGLYLARDRLDLERETDAVAFFAVAFLAVALFAVVRGLAFRAVATLFFAGTARFAVVLRFLTVVAFFAVVAFLAWVVFLAVRAVGAAVTFPANARESRKRRIRANREKNTMFKPIDRRQSEQYKSVQDAGVRIFNGLSGYCQGNSHHGNRSRL